MEHEVKLNEKGALLHSLREQLMQQGKELAGL